MAEVHINPNLENMVAQSPELRKALLAKAEKGADWARAIAPVAEEGELSAYDEARGDYIGKFRDSIEVEWVTAQPPAPAGAARIQADVRYAGFLERGTKGPGRHRTPAFATLLHGLEYAASVDR